MSRLLTPFLVLLFALFPSYLILRDQTPPPDADIQVMSGVWKVGMGSLPGAEAPGFDDTRWESKNFPQDFSSREVKGRDFWFRRSFTLRHELESRPLFFTLGDLSTATLRIYMDGRFVGDVGDFEHFQTVGDFSHWSGLALPAELATPGTHVIAMHVHALVTRLALGNDNRVWIGRADVLQPFHQHISASEDLLRSGPTLMAIMFCAMLVALWRLSSSVQEARGARSAFAMTLGAAFYMVAQTGLFFGRAGAQGRVNLLMVSIPLFCVAGAEIIEEVFLGRVTVVRRVVRVLGVSIALIAFVDMVVLGHSMVRVLAPSDFFTLLCGIYFVVLPLFGLYQLARGRPNAYPALSVACVAVGWFLYDFSGIAETLVDLGVVNVPRLFSANILVTPFIAGVLVLTNFLRVYRRNHELTNSLTERNTELVSALDQAREATRVKGEFVASISHELRTPLNSIINIPEGLLEDFPRDGAAGARRFTGDASETARFLETLHRNGTHLLGVVNQLLDFSKLDAGRMDVHLSRVVLRPLVEDVLRTINEAFAKKAGVTLTVHGPLEETVDADPLKLAQVLLNLLSNAVKFSPGGSGVSLTVVDEGASLLFTVRDHGIGIAAQDQELVFQMFRQVEGGATRRFGGTGLGLPIARQLVELHGGRLWLESVPGEGSAFFFRIPKLRGAAAHPAPALEAPPRHEAAQG